MPVCTFCIALPLIIIVRSTILHLPKRKQLSENKLSGRKIMETSCFKYFISNIRIDESHL